MDMGASQGGVGGCPEGTGFQGKDEVKGTHVAMDVIRHETLGRRWRGSA